MAKNTRRGASRGPARKKTPQRQVPGWVWLFTGLMVGLFVAFLFHLGKTQIEQGSSTGVTNNDKPAKTKAEPKPGPKNESGDDSPKFDFYAVLPKMEVIVPQNETGSGSHTTSKPDATKKPTTTRKPEAGTRNSNEKYLLQAGSFRRNEDADRRRAELILKGFEANIQSVNLDSGDSWHRVMIGPYNNLNAMHRAQDQLASNGIETLPIKMKK
ncbi:cell division protein [Alcanivorax sp. 97CO-5]|uniref:SPOR domain-containing protein n=1 Tax=unclassified Alcanivorax TaxID=2638842 RepID=UPI0003E7F520|nr:MULTISPECIES: SPOR domain-containing protein [unclassified Alcanivorax]EUC67953.1 cell division protein [Alcanivorax sp. 97CO-5]PKG00381.1 cell division protein [Alcanivorax sp. 97CO-6]